MESLSENSVIDFMTNLLNQSLKFTDELASLGNQQKSYLTETDEFLRTKDRIDYIQGINTLMNSTMVVFIENGKTSVMFGSFLEMMTCNFLPID